MDTNQGPELTSDTYDVIVVGGGLAGLTAAATAARHGASVLVVDRSRDLGGRARTSELDGCLFNQGAHALYRDDVGWGVLKGLGITPQGEAPPLARASGLRDGHVSALPLGARSIISSRLLRAGGKVAWVQAMRRLQKTRADEWDRVSFQAWTERVTAHTTVQQLLHALARLATYANAPDLVSAGAVIGQLQGSAKGVLYLDNGWRQLVDALADGARTAGVRIEPGIAARAVEPTTDGYRVSTDRAALHGKSVVLGGLAPTAAAHLLGVDERAFVQAGPPAEAAVLDLSLRTPPPTTFILGIDQPLYFSVHSPPAKLAPAGRAAAVAMKYLPVHQATELDGDRGQLRHLARLAGADVSDHRFLRRMTVTHGMPLAEHGGLSGRPGIAVDSRPGLFVAGDWVGDRGLLADAALASGAAAGSAAAVRSLELLASESAVAR